jgi:O-antigen/teichoic acid export membrane protein
VNDDGLKDAGPGVPRFRASVGVSLLADAATVAIVTAQTAFVSRVLGPTGKGLATIGLLIPSVVGVIVGLGVNSSNVYFASSGRIASRRLTQHTITITIVGTAVAAVAAVLVIVTGARVDLLPGLPTGVLLLGLAVLPTALLSSALVGLLQGERRIAAANAVLLVQAGVTAAATLAFVGVLGWDAAGVVAASASGGLVAVFVALRLLRATRQYVVPKWSSDVARPLLRYGVKAQLGNVLQYFNYRLDVFLVNGIAGARAVGVYSVAVALGELLWRLPNAVGFVIFPMAAATSRSEMNRLTPRILRITLALTSGGAVALAVIGRPAISVLFSNRFDDAYPAMLILLPGVVLLGGAKVLANEIAGRGYPQLNSANAGVSLVVTVVLDVALIPRHGIRGAAFASSVAYTVVFVISLVSFVRLRDGGSPAM